MEPYRYWRGNPPLPVGEDVERFWGYVLIGSDDECWPWRTRKLGQFWWRAADGSRLYSLAPRLSFRMANPEVELGPRQVVAHRCDWRACCNPACLEAVSQQKNALDASARNRHPYMSSERYRSSREGWWRHGANGCGELNGFARLSDDAVKEIRLLYASGSFRQVDLAKRFQVSQSTISRVVRGASWSHVEGGSEV